MSKLGARLNTVLRSVPKGSTVADIGTDHAFLPIALIKEGIAKKVIASDINEKPLQNAKSNIEKSGLTNIELRLSDGLNNFSKNEVDCIIIAGMGGNVIRDILCGTEWLKNKNITLILQSMSSSEVLREYLYLNGFSIISEKGVTDCDRIYSVITARYSGNITPYSPAKLYIGELDSDNSPDSTRYIELQYNRLFSAAESLKNAVGRQNEYIKTKNAAEQLKKILDSKS